MKKQMSLISINSYIDDLYAKLIEADERDERRELMNALLRIMAMIIYESVDPEKSLELANRVIKATMEEETELVN